MKHTNIIQSPMPSSSSMIHSSTISHGRGWRGDNSLSFIRTHRRYGNHNHNHNHDEENGISISSSSPLKNIFLDLRGGAKSRSGNGNGSGSSGDFAGNDIIATFREELKKMREEFEKEAQTELQAAKEDIARRKEKEKEHDERILLLEKRRQEQEQQQLEYQRQLELRKQEEEEERRQMQLQQQQEDEDEGQQEQEQEQLEEQEYDNAESEEIMENSAEIEGDEILTDADDYNCFVVGDTDENDESVMERLLLQQRQNQSERKEKDSIIEKEEEDTKPGEDFVDEEEDHEEEYDEQCDYSVTSGEDGVKNIAKDSEEDGERPINENFQDDEKSQTINGIKSNAHERDSVDEPPKKKKKSNTQRKKRRKKKKKKELEDLEYEHEYETLTQQEVNEWHEKLATTTSSTQNALRSKEDGSTQSILTIVIKSLIPTIVVAVLLILSHIFFEALLKNV